MTAPRIIHLRSIAGGNLAACGRGGLTFTAPITDDPAEMTCGNCTKAVRSSERDRVLIQFKVNWAALKDYLTQRIEQDSAVAKGARAAGDPLTARSHGALVTANRSTLAKMRELEAGQ
jgi:hypothetical protein